MFMALSPHSSARAAPGGPAVPGSLTPQRLTVHGRDDPSRAEVESFIARVYASRHGAQVQHFAESLVALRQGNSIVAAAGYTPAGTAPLFLERYLSAPVQVLLAARTPLPVPRAGVVEVGHLAAERAGEGRRLIFLLAPHLASLGVQWVASTLTSELRQLFVRIGVTPHVLAAADPAALGPEARQWGSYYTHQPVVVAGHLPRVLQQWKSGGQA
jgi:hypothetical protein